MVKYKKINFGANTLICTECWNELRKQQVIDEIIYRKELKNHTVRKVFWDNAILDGAIMIDMSMGKARGPKIDYSCYKIKF